MALRRTPAPPVVRQRDCDRRSWKRAVAAPALREVMHSLTVADADAAFRAIALANPAGLGTVEEQDVHEAAAIDLRAAMALAADRDLIARQYANGYADLFEIGLPAWQAEYPLQRQDQLQPRSDSRTENECG